MKTTLTYEYITMPGADIGPENPLPDIKPVADPHVNVGFDPSVREEDRKYFGYGKVSSILPYRIQDGYDRNKRERDYKAVVLENQYIRAVFFPQFGGRLWSLYDKEHKRDLVHVNPVFQPANLALRNAWFSGGVEWNIGMTGHTPYTASPLHAAFLELADGTPVLRMYEWERIRQVSYQIDAFLPEDSRFLFVRVRLRNTRQEETPIYWWSNTAVNETPGTRVLAPTAEAFSFDYSRLLTKIPIPVHGGIDKTYTTRVPHALDLFFDLAAEQRKWEAALDEKGEGLVQTSTDRLQGRKLFMWGNGPGGKRWQEFLARPGEAYLEIQAGLANTQMEHLPMPGNACWDWLEAYGMMQADPAAVHGDRWDDACRSVEQELEARLPRKHMDELLERVNRELDRQADWEQAGSGWAALELARTGGADRFPGEYALFPEQSMGEDQQPWLQLLREGSFPAGDPGEAPAAYLTQREWIPLLEGAVARDSAHWHSYLQLGVMYCAAGEMGRARDAFLESCRLSPNAWAKSNLAMLALPEEGGVEKAADLMLEAARMLPILPIAIACCKILVQAGRFAALADFCDQLPAEIRNHGRIRTMRAHAAIQLDDYDLASSILQSGLEVSDVREGEVLLSDLWIMLHCRRLSQEEGIPEDDALRDRVLREFPIPEELDFRMRT